MDGINDTGDKLFQVRGWIFIPNISINKFSKYIILSNQNNTDAFLLVSYFRGDVLRLFHADLDYSGFNSYLYVKNLNLGEYEVSLYITDGIIGAL